MWIVRSIDLQTFGDRFTSASPVPIGAVALIVIVQLALLTLRWLAVLRAQSHAEPLGVEWQNLMVGVFFNQSLLSGVGGDAMRLWLLTRRGLSVGAATIAVVTDRITGLIALLVLVAVVSPFYAATFASSDRPGAPYVSRWRCS